MTVKNKTKTVTLLLSGIFIVTALVCFTFNTFKTQAAWQAPPGNPPSNNRPLPLDESAALNTKAGPLVIKGDLTSGDGLAGSQANLYLSGDEQWRLNVNDEGKFFLRFYDGVDWENYFFTVLTDGKAGLGTVDPQELFEVRDDTAGTARIRIADTGQNPELQLKYASGANDHWAMYVNQTSDDFRIWGSGVTGADRLILQNDGKIIFPSEICLPDSANCISDWSEINVEGLWTTLGSYYVTPKNGKLIYVSSSTLDGNDLITGIANNASASGSLLKLYYGNGLIDDNIQFKVSPTGAVFASTSIGIGTINPAYPLDLSGVFANSGEGDKLIYLNSNVYWSKKSGTGQLVTPYITASNYLLTPELRGGPNLNIQTYYNNGDIYFTTNGTGQVYVENSNFGVGTASPAEKLEVLDDVDDAGNVARIRITDVNQNPELQLKYGSGASDHWSAYVDQTANELRFWNTNDRLIVKPNVTQLILKDETNNPEIQWQYAGGVNDHWAIYANSTGDNGLKVWSPFSNLDGSADGDDIVTFGADEDGTVNFHGVLASDKICLSGDCQTDWPTTGGTYVGKTINTYDGKNQSSGGGYITGYIAADTLCSNDFAGSHVCSTEEILDSVTSGTVPDAIVWIFNGPPGYSAMVNDCVGRASDSGSHFGAIWLTPALSGSPQGAGAIGFCDTEYNIACCQ